jgi:alpha-L-fucosidase
MATMPPRYSPVKEVGGKTYYLPMQVHDSLSPSWFWKPTDPIKSVDDLKKLYSESVGRGASLMLNVPPDKTGQIPAEYVGRLQEFKQAIDAMESNGKP